MNIGELQTWPPIVPVSVVGNCEEIDRGFKKADLDLRARILAGLAKEFQGWKDLDGTHTVDAASKILHEALSQLNLFEPSITPCEFTEKGQDRKIYDSTLDLDQNSDTRTTACDLSANTQDYVYKGRVGQTASLDRYLVTSDRFRIKPCAIGQGNGFYFTNNDLRHTTREVFDDEMLSNIVLNKPELEIEKDNHQFPSHRFITGANLVSNFIHPTWNLKPWDPIFDYTDCPRLAPAAVPDINTRIEIGTDGDEVLLFDVVELTYYGNGREPDVASYSDHSSTSSPWVTHAIISTIEKGHPAITQDTIVYAEDLVGSGVSAPTLICVPEDLGIIFKSGTAY